MNKMINIKINNDDKDKDIACNNKCDPLTVSQLRVTVAVTRQSLATTLASRNCKLVNLSNTWP